MECFFFDFKSTIDLKTLYILIFVLVSVAFLIFIIIYFFVTKNKNIKQKKEIEEYFKTSCVYVVNYKTKNVKWFFNIDTSKFNYCEYDTFLGFFAFKERKEISLWFENLLSLKEPKENDLVMLVTEIKNLDRKNVQSTKVILEVKKIDKEENILYLEKTVLKNLPISIKKKGRFGKVKLDHKIIYSYAEISEMYSKGDFNRGSFYHISFVPIKEKFSLYNEKALYYKILNVFFETIKDGDIYSYINEDNPLEISIIDNRYFNNYQLIKNIEAFSFKVDSFSEALGCINVYNDVIVVGKCLELNKDLNEALVSINKYSLNLLEEHKSYGYYYSESKEIKAIENTYINEVNKVIRNEAIDIYFKPIIRLYKNKIAILGYQYEPILKEGSFSDFDEFKKYSIQFDLRKESFSLVTKKSISSFVSQKDNVLLKLFSLIELEDIAYANRLFPHINNLKDANLVLTFKNNAFIDFEDDQEYIHVIKGIQAKGYECALFINLNDYSLKDSTYKNFNYFLFDFKSVMGLKQTSREFVKIHSLLEKFVKFNKPIICLNVNSWSLIEMLIKSGICYFSGDIICPNNTLLLPLDKKVTKKLLYMVNK